MPNFGHCQVCGGILAHFVHSTDGEDYRICTRGLTRVTTPGTKQVFGIFPCETVHGSNGKPVTRGETIGYVSDSKLQMVRVNL